MMQCMLDDTNEIDANLLGTSKFICHICPLVKHHRLSFIPLETVSTKPFEIISVDIGNPNSYQVYDGCKYFLTIIDQFTRCTQIYTLSQNLRQEPHFKIFSQLSKINLIIELIQFGLTMWLSSKCQFSIKPKGSCTN